MADIITQLQTLIQDQSFFMTNAIGVLVLQAPACDFNSTCEELINETQSEIAASAIAKCARDISKLIDTVPTDGPDADKINETLLITDSKRQKAARELETMCKEGEILADKIQQHLDRIFNVQLESRARV